MAGIVRDESALIASLRAGDEVAFAHVVALYTPSLLRVARIYVRSREVAEEVVQATWIALVKGLPGFSGRSSLRTWLFAVMVNIAKARRLREARDSDAAGVGGRLTRRGSARPVIVGPGIGKTTKSPRHSGTVPRDHRHARQDL